jgi:hypothetical protein
MARVSSAGFRGARGQPRSARAADRGRRFCDRGEPREEEATGTPRRNSTAGTHANESSCKSAARHSATRSAPGLLGSHLPFRLARWCNCRPPAAVPAAVRRPPTAVSKKMGDSAGRLGSSSARRSSRRAIYRPSARPSHRDEPDQRWPVRIDYRFAANSRHHCRIRAPIGTVRHILACRALLSGRHEPFATRSQEKQQHDRKHDSESGRCNRQHRPQQPDRAECGEAGCGRALEEHV